MSDYTPPAFLVFVRTLIPIVFSCWVLLLSSGCDNTKYRTEMRAYEEYQEAVEECWGLSNYENCMKTRGWLTKGDYEVVDN